MGARAWSPSSTWSESIAAAFEERLRRARHKSQYLRIQAHALAASQPKVALNLLERYFSLEENFDMAQAHCDRAVALAALERPDDAVAAYEAALAREATYPHVKTEAYVDLPYLVATHKLSFYYARAQDVLETFAVRLVFPIEHFKWHAANAIISAAKSSFALASSEAKMALTHAARTRSGFARHPELGLVGAAHQTIIRTLEVLADA